MKPINNWLSIISHKFVIVDRIELVSIWLYQYQYEGIENWYIFRLTILEIDQIPLNIIIGSVTMSKYCEVKK